jgi:DUF1680 family protein
VVAVTTTIDGDAYGAINVNSLHSAGRFPAPIAVSPRALSPTEKTQRWQSNWCCPVTVVVGCSNG